MLWNPIKVGEKSNPVGIVVTILEFLGSLLGLSSDHTKVLQTAINNTYTNLVTTSAFLYNSIGFLTQFIEKLLKTLLGGIIHIISDVLHGHLSKALEDIQKLFHALHNLFAPLLDWLHRLQKIQRQLQMQSMKNILNLMQRVRKILAPFRILHVKFAEKLDRWLAGIEGRIITREMAIVHKTNEIIGWIDLITDPTGGMRGPPILLGARQFGQALLGALGAVGYDKIYPARAQTTGPLLPTRPFYDWQAPSFKTSANSPSHFEEFKAGVLETYRRMKEEMKT